MISDIVQNGYETLLPLDLPSSSGFRALRDALISAEKWSLAIDVSLKNGFATSDVMAAWGLTCLKAGCYEAGKIYFVVHRVQIIDISLYLQHGKRLPIV